MRLGPRVHPLRSRHAWAVVATLTVLAAVAIGASRSPRRAPDASLCSAGTEALMLQANAQRYGPYTAKPASVQAAATINVVNYQFDSDNNLSTQVDQVHITAGQSVLFQWVAGVHTATSGYYYDALPGQVFDFPVDVNHQQTVVTFPTAGTYPFFCQYHGELFNMTGSIVVDAPTPTRASTWGMMKARYR